MFLSISFGFGRSHIYQLFGVEMFFLNGRFFFQHVCIYTQIHTHHIYACIYTHTNISVYLEIDKDSVSKKS